MELLDRYLQGVKRYLPWQRQDDILAELKANLEAQLEEREAELGRPMTKAEAEAWIKQLGAPMRMAARYQRQQYLIGPGIFPVYWFVLRMALFWAAIIYLIVSAVLAVVNSASGSAAITELIAALFRTPNTLLITAAWVTLVFAVLDYLTAHYPETVGIAGWSTEWNPGTLPPIDRSSEAGKNRRSFAKAIAEVIFGVLFLGWLLLVPRYPYLMFGPGVFYMQISRFQLAPVWMSFFWSMVALSAFQIVWRSRDLWTGDWQKPRTASRITFKAIGLVPLLFLINAPGHVLVALKDPSIDPSHLGPTLDLVNRSVHMSLELVCVIVGLQLAWEIGQAILTAYRKRETAR